MFYIKTAPNNVKALTQLLHLGAKYRLSHTPWGVHYVILLFYRIC